MKLNPTRFNIPAVLCLVLAAGGRLAAQTAVADCAACHRAIADEWRGSLHREAYTTPVFLARKEELSRAGESSCDCHAPQQLAPDYLGLKPTARADSLQLGVDCISCHLDGERVAWSSGPTKYAPHWTRQAAIYASGNFCIGCHSWAPKDAFDCQECHMPLQAGPAADGPHLESPQGAAHRSHRWAASRDLETLAQAVSLTVRGGGESLWVEVANLVPAHQFPANSHRSAEIVLMDESGREPSWRQSLTLAADSTANFAVKAAGGPGSAWFELRYFPGPAVWPDSFVVVRRAPLP
ncbi:MAG: multiheme c-type cytochrome [Candidatus Glassbacteria bacterium]